MNNVKDPDGWWKQRNQKARRLGRALVHFGGAVDWQGLPDLSLPANAALLRQADGSRAYIIRAAEQGWSRLQVPEQAP